MGTHPIFESDFDCLTEKGKMNKVLLCIGMAAAAPALTFDRPTTSKKDIAFNPFNGKEIVTFDSLFENLDKLMNDPSGLFGPNLFDRVFNDGNDEIIEEIQGSGDSTPMLFF